MGEPTPPVPPSGPCPECCIALPPTMNAKIQTFGPAGQVYEGTVDQDPGQLCRYTGYLFGEISGYVWFRGTYCGGGIDVVGMACDEQPWCYGRDISVPHVGCFPPVTGTSDDGIVSYSMT